MLHQIYIHSLIVTNKQRLFHRNKQILLHIQGCEPIQPQGLSSFTPPNNQEILSKNLFVLKLPLIKSSIKESRSLCSLPLSKNPNSCKTLNLKELIKS